MPTDPPKSDRFAHLDGLRGLAALSVVFLHFLALSHPGAVFGKGIKSANYGPLEQVFAETPLHLLISGHGAVHLFFVLSGFVLSWAFMADSGAGRTQNLIVAVVKRPIRLLLPIVAVQILAVGLLKSGAFFHQEASAALGNSWLAGEWQTAPGWGGFLRSLVTHPFTGGQHWVPPLWTIAVELYGSWLVYAILLVGKAPWLRRILMLGCLAMMVKLPAMLSLTTYQWSNLQDFVLGMALADGWRNSAPVRRSLQNPWLQRTLLVVGLFFISYPAYIPKPMLSPVYGWLPTIPVLVGDYGSLGALCLMLSFLPGLGRGNVLLRSAPVQFLGRISYSLYAIHFVVLVTLCSWIFVTTAGWPTALRDIASLLALLIVSILAAMLMTRFLDTPGQQLANRCGKWLRNRM